jgi:quercetin dioxygenase-like cupin family protein
MAAASGVMQMAAGKGPREPRIIPLGLMAGDVELLYGEPEAPGEPFVMRIRELPGAMVPPHTHPVDEHITVVQGTWYFALGSEYKPEALRELKAGAYAFAPAGVSMFGFSPDGAIVQVHGIGPFRIHWLGGLHTRDETDWKVSFRIPRGTFVKAGARAGRVVQGYASGTITQYEVEEPSGAHFMAREKDLVVQ